MSKIGKTGGQIKLTNLIRKILYGQVIFVISVFYENVFIKMQNSGRREIRCFFNKNEGHFSM